MSAFCPAVVRADVLALLASHTPADPQEAETIVQIGRIFRESPSHDDLTDKANPNPGHLTTSALVVSPDGNAILLVFHPAFGRLLQPGGHLDPHDTSLGGGAARELAEETGLHPHQVTPLGLVDVAIHEVPAGIKGQAAHQHYDFRFGFQAHTEITQAEAADAPTRWVKWDDLETAPTDDSVRWAAKRLYQKFTASERASPPML